MFRHLSGATWQEFDSLSSNSTQRFRTGRRKYDIHLESTGRIAICRTQLPTLEFRQNTRANRTPGKGAMVSLITTCGQHLDLDLMTSKSTISEDRFLLKQTFSLSVCGLFCFSPFWVLQRLNTSTFIHVQNISKIQTAPSTPVQPEVTT